MKREAELLMLAVQQRHKRENAFLEQVMVSIAKASDAQNEMIAGIATALEDHKRGVTEDEQKRAELEGEIENVIRYIRKDTA